MTVYWILWIAILVLADRIKAYDHKLPEQLVTTKVKHASLAKVFFIVAGLLLIFISGCRYYVGMDFSGYYDNYRVFLNFWQSLKNFNEAGIDLVYGIATRIHNSAGMCIFTVSAVTICLELHIIYKYTDNIAFALVLYVFTCLTFQFNGVRQGLAIAVLLCGYPFLKDRKFIKYALVVFLAYLCHKSAAVMILVYFITDKKVNIRNIIIISVLTAVVLFSYDKVFGLVNTLMDNDVTGEEEYWSASINIFRVLTEVAPAIFFLIVYNGKEKNKEDCFYLNILIVHAVVGVATSGSACFGRMANYTMPFAVIGMAELVKKLPTKRRDIYVFVIGLMYWGMCFYEIYGSEALNNFQLKWFW